LNDIHVALAFIFDNLGRILITRRCLSGSHPGLWEVPGGKVEPFETPFEAMVREVAEEVGLQVKTGRILGTVTHHYSDNRLCLHVFQVIRYHGVADCYANQLALRWVHPHELMEFEFPEANRSVLNLMQFANESANDVIEANTKQG